MKQFYLTLIFFIYFFSFAQDNNRNLVTHTGKQLAYEQQHNISNETNLTASTTGISTSPTDTSAEVGVTDGTLNISLTGNANYTIPILVPPGINGVEPQISLQYNSQRGFKGTATQGWDIVGVSSITRIPSTKFHDGRIDPVDFNSYDRFALDGQRLVLKNGTAGIYGANGTQYETEYFSNIKITSYGVHPNGTDYGPAYFIVEYPNGNKAYYGNSTDSRSIMDWSITNIENPQKIHINYAYTTSNNSLYIDTITYGGLTPTTPINKIKFIYDRRYGDIEDGYVGGVNIKRDKNLININVSNNGTGYRNYIFDSDSGSKLQKVTEKNGDNSKSYNPTIFTYNGTSGYYTYVNRNNLLDVEQILSTNASTVSGDFDGDGNMDFILYPTTGSATKAKYWLFTNSNPNTPFSRSIQDDIGSFENISPVTYIDSEGKLAPTQGWTVIKDNTFTTFYLNSMWNIAKNDQKNYTFPKLTYYSEHPLSCIKSRPPILNTKDIPKDYLSGDFNGDGITDIVVVEKNIIYSYLAPCDENNQPLNVTETYYGNTYFINLDKRVASNFVNLAGKVNANQVSQIKIGDFNGDGKSDIFVFDTGKVNIYGLDINNQFVLLYQTQTIDTSIILDKPILLGDYNGDGKTDFMIPKISGSSNWYKYTSTGKSLMKEENSTIIFNANNSFNSYNYLPIDFNNDNKTDIICSINSRNIADTSGSITVECYENNNGNFSPSIGTAYAYSGAQADINIYALPVYLPVTTKISQEGVSASRSALEVAFLNQNKIHFFSSRNDKLQANLLTNIRTGDGVEETIKYIPLDSSYENSNNNIYTPSNRVASYPYLDIQINPNLYVVSKIELQSKDVYKKRLFGYYGAVSNVEGLGFIGFRSVTQTDWYDDASSVFTRIYKNDIDLRGANTETVTVPYLSFPNSGNTPSDFFERSVTSYNIPTESPLQANKVFKLKITNTKEFNSLTNTNAETKNIIYDNRNNITNSTILLNESGTLLKTITNTTDYQSLVTPYIVGRPSSKIQSISAYNHTMTTEETYTYNSAQLLSNVETSAIGTSKINETTNYDAYGNVIKKKVTTQIPAQSRITDYEYDSSARFLTKITDNDNLETKFTYFPNGMLKTKIDPYSSVSYTYDSWFKQLTVKNELLNKTISSTYTKDAEKTIITTTTDILDGSASEEIFDDLGRKIKIGSKNLNGTFSYTSFLYDIFDRNYKVSEPYFGVIPTQWNEIKFDIYNRPTSQISFNNRTITNNYSGLVSKTTDGLRTKTTTKNALGDILSSEEILGGKIEFSYFANGGLSKSKYNGIELKIEQDGWGRRTKLIDPSAGTFVYTNNDLGELLEESSQNGAIKTTYTYDASGRISKKINIAQGTNSETTYTYDATKLPLTVTYIDNNEPIGTNKTITTITYDPNFKRPISIVEDRTGVSKFTTTYDLYDGLGRVLTETKKTEIGGKISTVTTKKTYKNGSLHQILDINNKILWQTNTLNAKGQVLESITGNGIKMTNTYDSDGYLSKIQHDKTNAPYENIITLTTVSDKNTDNLQNRTNSAFGNYMETFEYDELNRLKKFTNKLGIQETQNYEASGVIKNNRLGTYDYDATKKYQNTSITLTPEATGYYTNREGIFNDSMEEPTGWGTEKHPNTAFYSYDNNKVPHDKGKNSLKLANTTTTEQYLFLDKWIDIDNAVPTQYTYSAWMYSDNPQAQVFLFMKDAAGTITQDNIVNNTKGSWVHITKSFLVPENVKKIRLRLDNNGLGNIWYDDVKIRKTNNASTTTRQLNITYNSFKSPIQIEETGVDKISFTYNDNNQRTTMHYGGLEADKLDRPLRKYYSADGSVEVKQNKETDTFEFITYIGGDGYTAPIAIKSDGVNATQNYLYLHRDYQGTILAVTNGSGAVVEKRLFDAWGAIIKIQDGTGNALADLTILDRGYTGHEHLQSIGLINMNARLYDPIIHRFLQIDNYIQDPTNTQNYNQYGYALNNPLLYIDPTGNTYSNGKDCNNCGHPEAQQSMIGGAIATLATNWDDLGIKDWAKKNLNFNSWGRSWNKLWGKNRDSGPPPPPPNMSTYVNMNTTGGGQYYGGNGSGNFMDYFSRFVYETDQFNPIALAWDGIKGNFTGSDRYGNDLSGFESNLKIVSAIPMTKVAATFVNSSIKSIALYEGKTFAQYKIAQGGTETLDFIKTTNASGQIVNQRISTEFHHLFITQRMQRGYGLPNWLVNNRLNVVKLNTIQHSLVDPHRFKFLRAGLKPEVGWFGEYNWFTKFPQ